MLWILQDDRRKWFTELGVFLVFLGYLAIRLFEPQWSSPVLPTGFPQQISQYLSSYTFFLLEILYFMCQFCGILSLPEWFHRNYTILDVNAGQDSQIPLLIKWEIWGISLILHLKIKLKFFTAKTDISFEPVLDFRVFSLLYFSVFSMFYWNFMLYNWKILLNFFFE
jgi:hypothetical protein